MIYTGFLDSQEESEGDIMANKDRPRATRKKKNDHEKHDKLAQKKAKRRAEKEAFKKLRQKSRRRGSKPLPAAEA